MKIRTFGYYFRQAFISMKRNGWMSIAAITTVAIAIFIVGIFVLLVMNANFIGDKLESNVEIVAFVEVDQNRNQVLEIGEQIKYLKGVVSANLVPKEQGLELMRTRFGNDRDLLGALGGDNPLPDYYVIKVKKPEEVAVIARALEQLPHIYKVEYGQGQVERLFEVLQWMRLIGSGIIILLAGAAVFLVATTVRLTVFARRKEISIMKFVGATDWFIRWPFFLEGLFLGAIGALLASAGIYLLYDFFIQNVSYKLVFVPLITDYGQVLQILWKLLLGGAGVGAVGSVISVRRFLQV